MMPINDHQWIVFGQNVNDSTYLKYDALKDDFSEPIKYEMSPSSKPFFSHYNMKCCYNENNQSLYVYDNKTLMMIDTKTNEMNIITDQLKILAFDTRILCIDNTIDALCRDHLDYPDHVTVNTETLQIIRYPPEKTKLKWISQLIPLKSQKCILALNDNNIYKYSINENKWSKFATVPGLKKFQYSGICCNWR